MQQYVLKHYDVSDRHVLYCSADSAYFTTHTLVDTAAPSVRHPILSWATYPEPRHLGSTPSYGLFARHVVDLRLRDVRFELMAPDERPAILTEDVEEPSR